MGRIAIRWIMHQDAALVTLKLAFRKVILLDVTAPHEAIIRAREPAVNPRGCAAGPAAQNVGAGDAGRVERSSSRNRH
jgi:hypothetical protein